MYPRDSTTFYYHRQQVWRSVSLLYRACRVYETIRTSCEESILLVYVQLYPATSYPTMHLLRLAFPLSIYWQLGLTMRPVPMVRHHHAHASEQLC